MDFEVRHSFRGSFRQRHAVRTTVAIVANHPLLLQGHSLDDSQHKTVLGLVINTDFKDRSTGLQISIHSIHTVQGYSSIFPFIESQARPIELVAIIGYEKT